MKVRVLAGVCICILGISLPMIVMAETSSRRANIKSSGNIDFENGEVYITSSDLIYLADEIDNLEDTYKQTTVGALNEVGTFFLNDGTIVNDVTQNEVDTDEEKSELSFGKIAEGIKSSQSIASLSQTQATDKNGNLLYYATAEDQTNKNSDSLTSTDTGFPAFYQPANANNLSAGTAAWVDGTLIRGNGYDKAVYGETKYNEGYAQGISDGLSKANIQYVYHIHEGNAGSFANGCYTKEVYHRHISGCYGICNGTIKVGYTGWDEGLQVTFYYQYCQSCGADYTSTSNKNGGTCTNSVPKCGKSTTTTIDGYTIGCGKTTDTIESATIIF